MALLGQLPRRPLKSNELVKDQEQWRERPVAVLRLETKQHMHQSRDLGDRIVGADIDICIHTQGRQGRAAANTKGVYRELCA